MILFNPIAASQLIQAARSSVSTLRNQGSYRTEIVSQALSEFSGGYARAFQENQDIEAKDRARLARTIEDLILQVEATKRCYDEEKHARKHSRHGTVTNSFVCRTVL